MTDASAQDGPNRADRFNAYLSTLPFIQFLGIQFDVRGDEMTAVLPFQDKLIGNPALPALHGGAMGAFLELTAMAQLFLAADILNPPKPIDLTVDYLRSGAPQDLFGRATVTKLGRSISNVRAEAWQTRRDKPVAALHAHFLMPDSAKRDA